MNDIRIYSMDSCPYCIELKDRLNNMGLLFDEIDVNLPENEEEFNKLVELYKTDLLPIAIIGKVILIPDVSFKTIENASLIIKELSK